VPFVALFALIISVLHSGITKYSFTSKKHQMQKLMFLLCLCFLLLDHKAQAHRRNTTYTADLDTTLQNIEKKIYRSFVVSTQETNLSTLLAQQKRLEKAVNSKTQFAEYWLAYSYYYKSVYHLQQDDKKNAEISIKEGIQILDQKNSKNAEDLSLMAMLQSFSIQFTSGMGAGIISGRAKKNVQSALEMDPQNLRAHLVAGQLDFYTPAIYGGGKKAEEYFKKAISLPDQKVKNNYLPSWGKSTAYTFLIHHYLDKKNMDQAAIYHKEATALYPNDHQLAELGKKIKP
jgi:tetratricopeptide (TPR) repeat protein